MLICAIPYIVLNDAPIEFRELDIFYLILLATVFTVLLYLLVFLTTEQPADTKEQ